MMHGRSPYGVLTYLDNPIHHLPGALLLAAPFVWLGTSALQNLFWLVLLFSVWRRELGSTAAALPWFWLLIVGSPVVLHQVITGTGHVTNAIYVLLGLWWLVHSRNRTLPAAVWGVALASRANFLFLTPLAFGWLAQHEGWRQASRLLLTTIIVFAAMTLPLYVFDPQGFTPLEALDRISRFNEVFPLAQAALVAGLMLTSVVFALQSMSTPSDLWRGCAIVQSVPVVAGYLLGGETMFLQYGSFFLPFGVFAAATSGERSAV